VEEHSNTHRTPYLFNGKELDEETGLYYYGARFYEPQISVWLSVDPLAEIAPDKTPYHFVSNNPINRIDPDGRTDFSLNKKTGEVKQIGEANDQKDRILKTNNKGEVKYKRNGEAKVAIEGIEQGILNNGQNFKTENNLIAVGGEGQPTKKGVEAFALQLSDYVGTEIAGSYFSKAEGESTSHVSIGMYKNNSHKKSSSSGHILGLRKNLNLTGFFHTHPNGGNISNSDRLVPSDADLDSRNNALRHKPNLNFYLITAPVNYGDEYPKKIPYTTGYSRRLR
jgi:RHS repeat-associated protein